MRSRRLALLLCFAVLVGPGVVRAADYRETKVATQFQIFAPPNNDSNRRYSALIITAVSGTSSDPCIVDAFDDGADGDTDDEILGVSLVKGQSVVRYIKDGVINDDYQGTWDGDYFRVASTQPVVVHLATDNTTGSPQTTVWFPGADAAIEVWPGWIAPESSMCGLTRVTFARKRWGLRWSRPCWSRTSRDRVTSSWGS